jgi:phosphoesterase RecJ-like protein
VALKSTSTAEVIFSFVEFLGENLFDENIATSILAGIISKTRSFQTEKTSPQTFNTAANLISSGADQQKIVQNMFKNKSLNMLQLWGRALSRVSFDQEDKIVATKIIKNDFDKTSTNKESLHGLEEELLATVGEAEMILILFEDETGISGYIKPKKPVDIEKLASLFSGKGITDQVEFKNPSTDIEAVHKEAIQKVKDFLKEYK